MKHYHFLYSLFLLQLFLYCTLIEPANIPTPFKPSEDTLTEAQSPQNTLDPITGKPLQQENDPLLVPVLMVKDEENVIVRTLEPFVKVGVQSYLIFDTGSTDKTVEVTREYFKAQNIQAGHIFQEPFVDFSTSRNRALELAEEQFPNAAFFIMVDAEWYLRNPERLIEFCKEHANKKKGAPGYEHSYLLRVDNKGAQWDYYSNRLFRRAEKLRYVGVVHEVIPWPTFSRVPSSIYFEQNPERYGNEKSYRRWSRDKEWLLKAYRKNPRDARTLFYLAHTYHCLGELENALRYYKERTAVAVFDEEIWMSLYYLAQITEELARQNKGYTWDDAFSYYLQAFTFRPKRAEPLIHIAKHYNAEGNNAMAYLFARRSVEIPFPADELLWVERELYEFTRYDILSKCAWYEKEFKVGEEALKKAIEARPNELYLYRNLSYYWDHNNN